MSAPPAAPTATKGARTMRIERRYTKDGQSPYADIAFRLTTSEIRNPDGSVVFRADERGSAGILVAGGLRRARPEVFPQGRRARAPEEGRGGDRPVLAVALGSPTMRRSQQLPEKERTVGEQSSKQVFDRLAGTWTYWGWKGGYFDSEDDARAFFDEHALHARHADGGAELAAMVQHRPALGLRHRRPEPGPPLRRLQDRQADQVEDRPTSTRSRTPASSSRSTTTSSTRAASWTCGCARRACSSTAPAPAPTSRGCAPRTSGSPAAASRPGLMSFLKIGDRAAGAIKSGGTTRRAAKMVIVDTDHPDIEQFIDWKVKRGAEGRGAGHRLQDQPEAPASAILKACVNCEGSGDDCFQPEKNPALKREIKLARKNHVADNYIQRVIQFAKQGYTDIDFPIYDTDWDSRGLSHRLRPELQQLGARHRRVPQGGRSRRRLGPDLAHQARQGRQDRQGARTVGEDRPRRLGLRRSRPAVPHHRQRLAHLPGVGPDPRLQSVLGIHVPRRHRLQSGVDEPAGVPDTLQRFK